MHDGYPFRLRSREDAPSLFRFFEPPLLSSSIMTAYVALPMPGLFESRVIRARGIKGKGEEGDIVERSARKRKEPDKTPSMRKK